MSRKKNPEILLLLFIKNCSIARSKGTRTLAWF